MDGSDVIAALGGKMGRLVTKIDAIYASLQRRTSETWNDAAEFALWAVSNCHVDVITGGIKLGTKVDTEINESNDGSFTSGTSRYRQGFRATFNEDILVKAIEMTGSYSSPLVTITRVSDLVVVYQGSGNDVFPNVVIPAGQYYVDISSATGDNESAATTFDMALPWTSGDITIELGYYRASADLSSLGTTYTDKWFAVDLFQAERVEQTGITTGIAESPLVSPTDLVAYDMVDYIIEANEGSYQVDILDSVDAVLLADVEKLAPLAGLPTDKLIKAKVIMNRSVDTDISPEIKSLTLAYLE